MSKLLAFLALTALVVLANGLAYRYDFQVTTANRQFQPANATINVLILNTKNTVRTTYSWNATLTANRNHTVSTSANYLFDEIKNVTFFLTPMNKKDAPGSKYVHLSHVALIPTYLPVPAWRMRTTRWCPRVAGQVVQNNGVAHPLSRC